MIHTQSDITSECGDGAYSPSVWLVTPLISKLPQSVLGRVLKCAGQVLGQGQWWHSDKTQEKRRSTRATRYVPLSLSLSSPRYVPAHTHTHTHTHTLTHSLTHSNTHTHIHSLSLSLPRPLTHSNTHTHTPSLSLSLAPSLTHSKTHTISTVEQHLLRLDYNGNNHS